MKFILSGEMEEEVAEALDGDGNVVKTRHQVDPREALRRFERLSMLCIPSWTLCLTSRGYPHEVQGELEWKALIRPLSECILCTTCPPTCPRRTCFIQE
jgi:hypothetical protein